MLLSGWFGWSVLWILPLLLRLCRVCILKTARWNGPGSIRLWLGTLLTLLASSGLEALLADAGPSIGAAVADTLAGTVGTVLAALLLLAVFACTMPWLFGASLFGLLRRRGTAQQPPPRRLPAAAAATVPPAPSLRPATRVPDAGARRVEPWRLPAPLAGRQHKDKFAGTAAPRANTTSSKARTEWAPFESIRPTSAMLARARTQEQQPAEPLPQFARQTAPATRRSSGEAPTPVSTIRNKPSTRPPQEAPVVVPAMPEAAPPAALSETPLDTVVAAQPLSFAAVEAPYRESMLATTEPAAVFDVPTAAPAVPVELAEPVAPVAPIAPVEPVAPAAAAAAFIPAPVPPAPSPVPERPLSGFAFQAPSEIGIDLPGLDLLDRARGGAVEIRAEELAETGQLIEQRLKEFKVPVSVLGACAGPVITRFEVEPAVGVRGAQIVGLMKDLSRALGLTSIRVVETIPGKTCMGLELPNAKRQTIRLSEMLEADAYRSSASRLTLAMGKDITGAPVVTDLARAPHMLVAGTTGSGKSVAINAMILSLLYKATPAEVRMIMIDPKMLELSVYDGIPHLLAPVVTDMKLAANALNWCVGEMEKRYRLLSALGVRNLAGYNQKIRDAEANERKVPNPFSLTPDAPEPLSTLPLIVVVIDELADLMMVAGKKIEELIARLAQKARAAGIHLILATQRPSVDVITGLIKANIPTRVAFQVSSKIDSRTVLDQMGAETLLGHGDMLFLPPGSGYPQRVHGAFVSDEEVHRVVEYLKQFGEPEYEESILAGPALEEAQADLLGDEANPESDPLYDEAVAFVIRSRRASISSVQRQLRIGYNRAARLVEQMEAAGLLSAMAANGSREILAPPSDQS